tara:strand:+ start:1889 stop:2182 length:294 start_codon:yes stop_codon:yes gene_type:complete
MAIRTISESFLQDSAVALNKGLGVHGVVMVTGTAAQSVDSGTYFAVQFVTDCTPTTLTISNSTTVTSVAHKAGTVIYGDITAITAGASETYILYKAK